MVASNERLHPVRCLIDDALLQRLESWGRALCARPSVRVHYGDSLPLGYSARTALLVGLDALRDEARAVPPVYHMEGTPRALSVAMPQWFAEELTQYAGEIGLSRVALIRCALDRGLP